MKQANAVRIIDTDYTIMTLGIPYKILKIMDDPIN